MTALTTPLGSGQDIILPLRLPTVPTVATHFSGANPRKTQFPTNAIGQCQLLGEKPAINFSPQFVINRVQTLHQLGFSNLNSSNSTNQARERLVPPELPGSMLRNIEGRLCV